MAVLSSDIFTLQIKRNKTGSECHELVFYLLQVN